MHTLVPGAPMDSSADLRDSDIRAIRCADGYDQLRSGGYLIRESLVVPPHKSQPVSHPCFVCPRATYAGCELHTSQLPGSPPGMLYSVRSSYYGTFLVFRSLLKIETERRREGK